MLSMDRVREMGIPKDKDKNYILMILTAILASTVFVLLFSYSTSPIYYEYYGEDSAQFLLIGKAWSVGRLPYRDMFDHKGPFIFFVDMIGFLLTPNSTIGVMLLQIVSWSITLIAVFNISNLFTRKVSVNCLFAISTIICAKMNYAKGDEVEEFCLPFIAISTFGILSFFLQNKEKDYHNPVWGSIYGVTFAICLMTRLTNAITICPGILFIAILLIFNRQFKNLAYNVICFLIGMTLMLSPFVLYFAIKGCLSEALFCTLTFNVDYAITKTAWINNLNVFSFFYYTEHYFLSWSILIAGLIAFGRKDYITMSLYIFTGICETILFCAGDMYPQYPMVCLIQVPILLGEGYSAKGDTILLEKLYRGISYVAVFIFCCYGLSEGIPEAIKSYRDCANDRYVAGEEFLKLIPESDRSEIVCYGPDRSKEIYLRNNIFPCYKYFIVQNWHGSFSEDVKSDIIDTFASGEAKWIIATEDTSLIDDTLHSKYDCVESNGTDRLYRRK